MGVETALIASAIIAGIGTGSSIENGRQQRRLAGQAADRQKVAADAQEKAYQDDLAKSDETEKQRNLRAAQRAMQMGTTASAQSIGGPGVAPAAPGNKTLLGT